MWQFIKQYNIPDSPLMYLNSGVVWKVTYTLNIFSVLSKSNLVYKINLGNKINNNYNNTDNNLNTEHTKYSDKKAETIFKL